MVELGFAAETVQWTDNRVRHDTDAFPELTQVTHDGQSLHAYETRATSVDELFRDAVASYPDREFVVFPESDKRFTYEQFDQRVATVAAGLRAAGVKPSDRVGLHLPNCPEFLIVFFACARINAIVAPVNTRLSERKTRQILNDVDPEITVTTAEQQSKVATIGELVDGQIIVHGAESGEYRSFDELRASGAEVTLDAQGAPPTEDDTALLIYTSGTTGQPKGCPVDNFQLTNAAENYRVSFDLNDRTSTLVPTPLFHVSGLVGGIVAILSVSGKAVVIDSFSPRRFLREVEREAVNYVLGVPTNYILTMERETPSDYDLSSLDICAYGSAPMPETVIHDIRSAFSGVALCNTYGKTESSGGLATMCPDEYTDTHSNTVGLPTPCMEMRIVDTDGTVLPTGEIGELAIRGPIVVSNYRNRPEKTADEFVDGWHLTGDIARIDEDGFVELKGRSKDMIIRGGENVHPIEIREVLASHNGVLESNVTGFPDEVLGERILAVVVPKPEIRLTENILQEYCESELADYKQPDLFRIVDSLPRNANGKVVKEKLLPDPLQYGINSGSST